MAVISRRVRSGHTEEGHGLLSSRNSRYPAFLTATLEQGQAVVMAGLRAEPTGTPMPPTLPARCLKPLSQGLRSPAL